MKILPLYAFMLLLLAACNTSTFMDAPLATVTIPLERIDQAILKQHHPKTHSKLQRKHSLAVQDIVALCAIQIAPDRVIELIELTHSTFHLNLADILHLQNVGVSYKVINFMIQDASCTSATTDMSY